MRKEIFFVFPRPVGEALEVFFDKNMELSVCYNGLPAFQAYLLTIGPGEGQVIG